MQNNTKKLVTMSVLIALSVVLVSLIHFPIFPQAAYLEYDPADIPILLGTFIYGPVAGMIIVIVESIIQGVTVSAASGPIGIAMHIFATGSFVLVTGTIYNKNKGIKNIALALGAGVLAMTVMMIVLNLIITPMFLGAPVEAVVSLLIPVIIPFNLIKAGVNSVISYFIYDRIKHFIGLRQGTLSVNK